MYKQIQVCKEIKDISNGKEKIAIPLKLNTDNDQQPNVFEYIKSCIGGPGVNLPKEPFYEGCKCGDICNPSICPCIAQYGPAYEWKNDILTIKDSFFEKYGLSQPVIECNSQCSCSHSCSNRLVQNGIMMNLEVFSASNKGWGLQTLQDIKKGQFVCEYAGEIISLKEAKRRTQQKQGDHNYIIVIKEHIKHGQTLCTHVDPVYYGNAGRFINHSCDPLLVMIPVRIDSLIPVLALFAVKDIAMYTELTFDYSGGGEVMQQNSSSPGIKKKCSCGSVNCAGYLPFDSTLF
ncbi:Histone-lysine N-methyltransferase SETMAR [Exaiptasia diaphana]|nr:Histone-lysine N-methyltransferase SETMAR [Exaiptasia diaphana]